MTDQTANTSEQDMTNALEAATDQTPVPAWKTVLGKSEATRIKGATFTKQAGALLWKGAREAVTDWVPEASNDPSAENLYNEVMQALGGAHRKGDASKIKTVAMATKDHGLDLNEYPNLSKAYAAAIRVTKTLKQDAADDTAADEATASLAEVAAPLKGTPEQAAALVLSKGVDEAARLLLDALGTTNEAAHRSFMRAVSAEVAGRIKVIKQEAKAGPKDGATEASKQAAPAKAKPVAQPVKAQPVKAQPVKAQPVKAQPVKAQPVKAQPVKAQPVKAQPVKARPAVKGPVK